jgi:glycosyltransferase involved in cell wall biosynthesis
MVNPLLIAEACNPEWVSIPLEGWSHARAIQSLTGGHLVTQIRNRDAILRAGLVEGKDFTAINSEAVAARVYKIASLLRGGKGKGWTTNTALNSLVYPYFERLVWKQFADRIRAGEFNVVHRITPTTPTSPSPLAAKCRRAKIPFVIGPLNGGVPWPAGFDSARRKEREWLSYIRGIYKLLPGYRSTRRNAAALLIGSQDTWNQMPHWSREKCFYVPENAVDPARFTTSRSRRATSPLKIIFVGRLVPYKGADMLLEAAVPLIQSNAITLKIIGDGPQKPALQAILDRERITSGVELAGWVPHEQLQTHLADADLFAFPSVREFGGAVVLEAMAVGLVPAVIAYGGPAELVTEKTGFLIPLGRRDQIIERFRNLLTDLSAHPEKIDARSTAARRRALEQFTWQAKAASVLKVYEWLIEGKNRPDFPMPVPDL